MSTILVGADAPSVLRTPSFSRVGSVERRSPRSCWAAPASMHNGT